ncbi:hypothetical protein [Novosphingobium resinovorum]|uniref:hypothetical protein n=1 Tax=Novosphingobium resinovorum TaxID=158500 RepID=UPI002ECFFE01|nr:hypothetical protein [Novosphingobium resinovorum]
MRTPLALALTGAALAGCTVIPPADPARMQSYPPAYPQQSAPPPPPPAASYPAPAVTPPYTPVENTAPAPEMPPAPPESPLTYAALGQTVTVGGPRITPLQVLEDSRCPMNARCVWAGQVRLRVRIESGRGGELELTSGKPATVADGTLELVEVQPDKVAGSDTHGAVKPSAYRFGFRFMGGY